MEKEKILIVDDEVLVREMVRDMLDAAGYRTVAVDSGKSALKIAQEEGFDLLLADIRMPDMNGLELVTELQRLQPDVISILITGYASIATAQQAIQQGVYDYVVKPFDRSELTTAVEGALVRKRLSDENARLQSVVDLLQQSLARMEGDCLASLRSIAAIIDGQSPYTAGHMERVARLSRKLASRIGLTPDEVEIVGLAASLHDLGKIGEIARLKIPGELSPEEQKRVKRHPVIADEILAPMPFLDNARAIIRHHHEQLDGKGYPDGLSGTEITPAMHVLIIVNVYDRLIAGCAGSEPISPAKAILKLQEGRGTRFEPAITDSFIDMMRTEETGKT
ncbi:MAG: response regulator [Chloroflexi bacterium]|nr:response regulator [Chloroflexota bacterium]